jgi:hypothetical protein
MLGTKRHGSVAKCVTTNRGRATDYALGGLIGYDPVALKMVMTESFYHADELGGFACGPSW